jgi:hypothetical protein
MDAGAFTEAVRVAARSKRNDHVSEYQFIERRFNPRLVGNRPDCADPCCVQFRMTTIAYKDGVIAYDGRVSARGTIIYDDFDKKRERDGVLFFGTGSTSDINDLVAAYFGESIAGECGAAAMVLHDDALMLVSYEDGKLFRSPILFDRPYAIGSGTDHAYTAFDMGATAYQAVEMAAKRDTGTGGLIRTLTIKA